MSQPQEDPIVNLRLRLNMVNGIIMGLDQVAGTRQLVNYIEAQTRQQVEQMQRIQQLAAEPQAEPPPPATPADPPAEPAPKPVAKAVRRPRKK
jgi:uncharacterized coiled-coil protein SlyX